MSTVKKAMEMSWKEVDDLPKDKTLVFVTIAPVEEHGRHLPLGVDIYLGEKWVDGAVELLEKELTGFHFIKLPYIPLACGDIEGFPFNFYYKQSTLYQVTYQLLEQVVKSGFKHIIALASHGDPRHQNAVEEACERINKKYGTSCLSPMGAFFSYQELSIDLQLDKKVQQQIASCPADYHAGWLETAAMLDVKESLVKENFKTVKGIKAEIKDFFSPKKLSEKIAGQGHIGFPEHATKELGTLVNLNTSSYLYRVILAFIKRSGFKKYEHGMFFKIPFLRTNFVRNVLLAGAAVISSAALFFLVYLSWEKFLSLLF